jgi:hypothetical protein
MPLPLELYKTVPDLVRPESARNEVPWGPSHVIYVWVDALTGILARRNQLIWRIQEDCRRNILNTRDQLIWRRVRQAETTDVSR